MDNEDLDELEKQIAERKESNSNNLPTIDFESKLPQEEQPKATDTAQELVEQAFNQAVVHQVKTDESVQQELLDSANKVVHNKMNAVKARADQEDKETHFNNKKGACECFGYNETTTEKWAVNVMNFWHNIMTAIWLFVGFFTFAPVTFVAKKIVVIFKKSWLAILIAIIIYLAVLATPFLVTYYQNLQGGS